MSDMKQVKIDNWGIFFLQRLQQFFNRTDFCDLTLQFENNVQLKVHRLVMNACTEYFQLLESTCEIVDDCLVMPLDLQPDVVVPIVNFMYTGQLEFQMSNFDKLYAAAKLMNLTVLTKLLDAQKIPPVSTTASTKPINKRNSFGAFTWNAQGKRVLSKTTAAELDLPETLPGRKIPVWKRKNIPSYNSPFRTSSEILDPLTTSFKSTLPKPLDNTPRPTRFEWPEDEVPSAEIVSSFDDISYGSQPLATPIPKPSHLNSSTMAFEEIKKTAQTLKKPNNQLSAESVNLQDVKEYLQEQRLRNDYILKNDERISATNEDSNDEYRDDGEIIASEVIFGQIKDNTPNKSILKPSSNDEEHIPTKKVRFSLEGKENTTTTTTTTSSKGKVQKQLIQAKLQVDSSDLSNHTKIISEVLKKYPHLVQKNKNIKLKIMKKNASESENCVVQQPSTTAPQQPTKTIKTNSLATDVKSTSSESTINTNNTTTTTTSTMSSNKKSAAENVTAHEIENKILESWNCKECNIPNEYIQLRSYAEYHDHLLEFHPEKIDARVCEYCGHKSTRRHLLLYHQYIKHSISPPAPFVFPQCELCDYIALNATLLLKHQTVHENELKCCVCSTTYKTNIEFIKHCHEMDHNENMNFDCEYCHKKFLRTTFLIAHMRTYHKAELEKDKILDDPVFEKKESKKEIKIISNISLNTNITTTATTTTTTSNTSLNENLSLTAKAEHIELSDDGHQLTAGTSTSETETLVNVATNHGITSLGLVVLNQNQQFVLQTPNAAAAAAAESSNEYIIPEINDDQLVQSDTSQTIALTVSEQQNAIIPQANIVTTSTPVTTTDELVMVLTDHDYGDGNNQIITSENSNIVVLYSHPVEGQDAQYISSEGNIVLNSQTGVIEMNGHQIQVANTAADALNISTDEQKESGELCQEVEPEESIEMIQQEINSHFQTAAKIPANEIISDTIQANNAVQIITNNAPAVAVAAAAAAVNNVQNEEMLHIDESTVVEKDTNLTIENKMEIKENLEMSAKESTENILSKELVEAAQEKNENFLNITTTDNIQQTTTTEPPPEQQQQQQQQTTLSENTEPEPMDVEEDEIVANVASPIKEEQIVTAKYTEKSIEQTNKNDADDNIDKSFLTGESSKQKAEEESDIHLDEPMDIDEEDNAKNDMKDVSKIEKSTSEETEKENNETRSDVVAEKHSTTITISGDSELNDIVTTIPVELSSVGKAATTAIPSSEQSKDQIENLSENENEQQQQDVIISSMDNDNVDKENENENETCTIIEENDKQKKRNETEEINKDNNEIEIGEKIISTNDSQIIKEDENLPEKKTTHDIGVCGIGDNDNDNDNEQLQKNETEIDKNAIENSESIVVVKQMRSKDNLTELVSDWCDDDSGLQGHTNELIADKANNEKNHAEFSSNISNANNEKDLTISTTNTTAVSTTAATTTAATSTATAAEEIVADKMSSVKITKLLDDWDDGDTDSQNSGEVTQGRKNPINNLIDDWEDDE